ncbi:MAG: alpha/beta hydrolase [Phycisphaerales bacterium]|nr:alpha/beta hydrolase [Phycisphaerales bacterium]
MVPTRPGSMPMMALLAALALAVTARAQDLSQPGPRTPARRDVTVVRANGSTFAATVHYPGTSTSVGAPVDASAGPFPIVAFGHGFLSAVTLYASTGAHLASWGFIVILPQTQGGFLPSHSALAADMVSSLDWLDAEGDTPTSPWFGAVDGDRRGAMGHSMGGGCSLLAAQSDPRIRAVIPMAAADTNPSSVAASAGVRTATRLVVGSQDTIVPPATANPMYANLRGPSQLVSVTGGSHCGFIDSSIAFCDSGSISRTQQLAIVRRECTDFLLLYLAGESARWNEVWGPPSPSDGVVVQARQTPDLNGDGVVDGTDLGILLASWSNAGRGDLNGDGVVDGIDLGILLGAWTA